MNGKIDKFALSKYTAEQYPKLFRLVGEDGLSKIQKNDEIAASLVSALPDCDMVVYVGYSNIKSKPPKKITSFVDCKNGKRFFVTNGKIVKN